jgi:S-DNA-T family DNA segregation ATPase FtsK/SpoIIIE
LAKKKEKTEEAKAPFPYTKELQGLALVLIGLLGFGKFGPVGRIIRNFAVFLFGNWYILGLVIAVILGLTLLIKRKSPNYLNARLIGIYTIIIAILLLAHLEYIKDNDLTGVQIIKVTVNNLVAAFENINLIKYTGGGIIGGLFATAFVSLFDITGTLIVCGVLTLFGVVMLFDITLIDLFKLIFKPFKRKPKEHKPSVNEHEEEQIETEEDNRVVITNINEITHKERPKEVETSAPLIGEDVIIEETPIIEGEYRLPPIDLLVGSKNKGKVNSTEFISSNNKILERVFNDFGISGRVVEVHVGPTVTQYEIEIKAGTKVNKILSINREIALALAAKDVRIQAPIPGKNTIGIEIPNPMTSEVKMKDILVGIPRKLDTSKLVAPLGLDIMGNVQYFEINKAPHMLVAGSTGSGKSVCINNIITSILMRAKPDEVKMILVDPKKVELNCYEGVPHLLRPVVTDPKKAAVALQKVCVIMDDRYEMFASTGTRNIGSYNEYIEKHPNKGEKLPYILVIIDELADLMMVASKEVEEAIMRITQLARAAGIHLIVATQRPSTDVITGLIKSNIPTRVSFMVSSGIDSRTILDQGGAEKLLGKGDMLFLPPGESVPIRIQGSFVSDDEINRVVDFVKSQGHAPKFDDKMIDLEKTPKEETVTEGGNVDEGDDPLYNDIVEFAVRTGKISASLIQRKYRLGYNRAARIIDLLEERGIIGPQNGSKPREVLVKLNTNNEGVEE